MKLLTRGQKIRLGELTSATQLQVRLECSASGLGFDFSCFGLDEGGTLSDDRYFVFYNQKQSPQNEIRLSSLEANAATFVLDVARLPLSVRRLVFVATVDGAGSMSQLSAGRFVLSDTSGVVGEFSFAGRDFSTEKAIMVAEVYFKSEWRVAANGQGFKEGLSAVLRHFGGQEVEEAAPASAPPPASPIAAPPAAPRVSLDKDRELQIKLEKAAPQLVNLSKTLALSLEKKGLKETVARVALVLDASGSMTAQYQRGNVQGVVDRIATLAMRMDDDGELETWGFASRHAKLPSVSLSNVNGYVTEITRKHSFMSIIGNLGVNNNEPPVMRDILEFYRTSSLPAFVVFISDGGVGSSNEIKKVLVEASRFPIFWQFVGLGGSGYGILKELDRMQGRFVDNANFFEIDDWNRVSDAELYDRLLNEFPAWLRAAKSGGILR